MTNNDAVARMLQVEIAQEQRRQAEFFDTLMETEERLRELVREAHAATKDLRQAIRSAEGIADRILDDAEEMTKQAVHDALSAMSNETRKAMDAAVEKVGHEFQRLERLFIRGSRPNDPTLEDLALMRLESRGLITRDVKDALRCSICSAQRDSDGFCMRDPSSHKVYVR